MTELVGYSRVHYCRGCEGESRQVRAGHENSTKPLVEYWRCVVCGLQITSYADMSDAEGFCVGLAQRAVRSGRVATYLYDEVRDELQAALWNLYVKWDPAKGLTFVSYASHQLPNALGTWWRDWFGRNGVIKPLSHAVSLDDRGRGRGADAEDQRTDHDPDRGGLGGAAASREDRAMDAGSLALRRALAEGDRAAPRPPRGVGIDRAGVPAS